MEGLKSIFQLNCFDLNWFYYIKIFKIYIKKGLNLTKAEKAYLKMSWNRLGPFKLVNVDFGLV